LMELSPALCPGSTNFLCGGAVCNESIHMATVKFVTD
jgi:hypothetical protein